MPESQQPNQEQLILVGETNFRNRRIRFGIKTDDRRRHMYVIGKTGMGKSTMLEGMIFQDIQAGRGVTVVDPHGDLAEKVLDFIPSNRVNDVIYFNPADTDFPIAFNVLERVEPAYRHLVTSGLIGVFKKIWADSWGPRLEYLLRNSILALLDYPDSTLLGINRMLIDKSYRKKVIDKIQDPVVKAFWVDEYSKYPDKFATEAIAPIQNKVGQFLSSSLIRNIVGQVKSTISMREVMDNKKILILNLSKGRIGEDNSALLGAMMITKIQLAAMSRVDIPEKERIDFYLYVDEFQNFATDSFADILSEARKYRLNLIIAHQYIEQLGEIVQPAVFGNVGTIVVYRVGAADAEFLVKEFTPYFTEEDLVNLAKYNVYLKLMIDGVASNPFSATGLPPVNVNMGNREKIINVSRERYAKPRNVVEDKIRRWSGMEIIVQEEEIPYGEVSAKGIKEPVTAKPAERPAKPPLPRPAPAKVAGPAKAGLPKVIPSFRPQAKAEAPLPKPGVLAKPPEVSKPAREKVPCSNCGKLTRALPKPPGQPIYCKSCFKKFKKGELKIEAVEVRPSEPEISLEEALKRKPVEFKGMKQILPKQVLAKETLPKPSLPRPQGLRRSELQPKRPQPQQKRAEPLQKRPESMPYRPDIEKKESTSLKPGEVVKL